MFANQPYAMPDQHLPLTFVQKVERAHGQTTHLLNASLNGLEVGGLGYQLRGRSLVFIVGLSTRYEWQRRGVALALLDELFRREIAGSKRHLGANSARENTPEGERLLRSWAASRSVKIRRYDEGLDG